MGLTSDFRLILRKNDLISTIMLTFNKYRIIFLGYIFSMGVILSTSIFEFFNPLRYFNGDTVSSIEKLILGTMVFCIFLIGYLIKDQEIIKLQNQLREQLKIRKGIEISEEKIKNQLIIINQSAYILSAKKEYDPEIVELISKNSVDISRQLRLLQG